MRILIALLLTINAYAGDKVIEQLKAENETLKRQIDMNNRYILNRSKATSNTEVSKITRKDDGSERYFAGGIDRVNFNNGFYNMDAIFYGVSYGMASGNWTGELGVSQARVAGFPVSGSETVITNYKLIGKYRTNLSERWNLFSFVGLQNFSVSSPDAGLLDSNTGSYEAEQELDFVEYIEDVNANIGLELAYDISKTIRPRFRIDSHGMVGLHLDYRL